MSALTREQVDRWLKDRMVNCERIAKLKSGDDRAGWLEDADYFKAVIADRESAASAIRTIPEPTFVLPDWTAGDLKELADRLMTCAGTAYLAGERDAGALETRRFIKEAIVEASQLIEYHLLPALAAAPAEAVPPPLYAGNVFMIDGRLHRTCDCSPSINKCARGLPRTLLTTEFSRCMVPV